MVSVLITPVTSKFLQCYGLPTDSAVKDKLENILKKMLSKMESADNNATKNGDYAILFEAVNLIISFGKYAEDKLNETALAFLGRFIALNDANKRYDLVSGYFGKSDYGCWRFCI